jgi:ATP-binding cassette subfamily C protein LapB
LDIDKEIALLPHGYDTKINDGIADTIAPGIKQRISIARTLIKRPKIILFNNADKGLDKDGYNSLIKLLNQLKGKVCMIITTDDHNINALSDKNYIFDKGELREMSLSDSTKYEVKPFRELKI